MAAKERDFYKSCCKTTKDALVDHLKDEDFAEKRVVCSLEGTVHYSYDYAEKNFTTQLTLTSLVRFILRPRASAVCLEFAARPYRGK